MKERRNASLVGNYTPSVSKGVIGMNVAECIKCKAAF